MMTTKERDNVIDYMKAHTIFTVPQIQDALRLDYGDVRNVITDMEDDKNVEFLEGIVYKWVGVIKENEDDSDDDVEDSDEDTSSEPRRRPIDRRRFTFPWLRSDSASSEDTNDEDQSEDKDEDADEDEDEDSDSKAKALSDFLSFLDETMEGDIDEEKANPLYETLGGPIPHLPRGYISFQEYMARKNNHNLLADICMPQLSIRLPGAKENLTIHFVNDGDNCYIHDNEALTNYIKSKAEFLPPDTVAGWYKLIVEHIPHTKSCFDEEGRFRLKIDASDRLLCHHDAFMNLIGDIERVVEFTESVLRKKWRKDFLEFSRSEARKNTLSMAESILAGDIDFTKPLWFIPKVLELDPTANSECINNVLSKMVVAASRTNHKYKDNVISTYKRMRAAGGRITTVHFIMKQVDEIEE